MSAVQLRQRDAARPTAIAEAVREGAAPGGTEDIFARWMLLLEIVGKNEMYPEKQLDADIPIPIYHTLFCYVLQPFPVKINEKSPAYQPGRGIFVEWLFIFRQTIQKQIRWTSVVTSQETG